MTRSQWRDRRRPNSAATTCGFMGVSRRVFLLTHDFPPLGHPFLRLFQKSPVLFPRHQRQQFLQRPAAIAHQSDFHRIAQTDTFRIEVNLNAARLVRLGQELDVRE